MRVFVRCHAKLFRTQSRHDDIIDRFSAHIVSVRRGLQAERRIFLCRLKSDHSYRAVALQIRAGLRGGGTNKERAQLLKPKQTRPPVAFACLRIHLEMRTSDQRPLFIGSSASKRQISH